MIDIFTHKRYTQDIHQGVKMTAKISKIASNYKAAEEFDTTVGKEEW